MPQNEVHDWDKQILQQRGCVSYDLGVGRPTGRYGAHGHAGRQPAGQRREAVLFLDFDATYTTGAELPVDGGWSQL